MADQSQSVRMHTRSQGHIDPPSVGAGGDIRAPSGNNGGPEQLSERSSVNTGPPTNTQTQPEIQSAIPDISEPVLKSSDRRIRTLIAKTTTGKMVLDTSMTELNKMAKRHEDYRQAGEPAEMWLTKHSRSRAR